MGRERQQNDSLVNGQVAAFGQLHGAIMCAGGVLNRGLTVSRSGEATDLESWWKTVQLNIYGTYAVGSKVAAICAKNPELTPDGEKVIDTAFRLCLSGHLPFFAKPVPSLWFGRACWSTWPPSRRRTARTDKQPTLLAGRPTTSPSFSSAIFPLFLPANS